MSLALAGLELHGLYSLAASYHSVLAEAGYFRNLKKYKNIHIEPRTSMSFGHLLEDEYSFQGIFAH